MKALCIFPLVLNIGWSQNKYCLIERSRSLLLSSKLKMRFFYRQLQSHVTQAQLGYPPDASDNWAMADEISNQNIKES